MTPSNPLRLPGFQIVARIGDLTSEMYEAIRLGPSGFRKHVAVKRLPDGTDDARTRISSHDHENLVRIHDLIVHDGYFLVMELLRGRNAEDAFGHRPVPWWIAAEIADQALAGLEHAHGLRLVHGSLSARSLFLTQDGTVKILNVGLAPNEASDPESDLHQLAGIVQAAIGDDPPEALRAWLASRFASAAEMREALKPVLASAPERGAAAVASFLAQLPRLPERVPERRSIVPTPKPQGFGPLPILFFVIGMIAIGAGSGVLFKHPVTKAVADTHQPQFDRLTFRRGTITAARFAPDGMKYVYAARWGSEPSELFLGSPNAPETRSLELKNAELVGLSQSGEMALLIGAKPFFGYLRRGTLARAELAGGAMRELLADVQWADWSPSGELAVLRWDGQRTALEMPEGTVLYETEVGCLEDPRISPDGSQIAFILHPVRLDASEPTNTPTRSGGWASGQKAWRGQLAVIDRDRKLTVLTEEWNNLHGVAWKGDQILFTGNQGRASRELWSVSIENKPQVVLRTIGSISIQDVAPNGKLLLVGDNSTLAIEAIREDRRRDLSWFDLSYVGDLSTDGSKLLFGDSGDALPFDYGVYLRGTDGSPAVHLDQGVAAALSPAGRWAIAIAPSYDTLRVIPTGTGEAREIDLDRSIEAASWFPDGERILVSLEAEKVGSELAIIEGSTPRKIAEGLHFSRGAQPISPDGKLAVVTRTSSDTAVIFDLERAEARPLPGAMPGERALRFSADGSSVFLAHLGEVPAIVVRVELATGARTQIAELVPADPAGVVSIIRAAITPDGRTLAYNYLRVLSTLYLADYQ